MATDFRDGKTFPRRGRQKLGDYAWLARMSDKGRAAAAGTLHEYIYPCPMDRGVLERWGVTVVEFDRALQEYPDDGSLLAWAEATIGPDRREGANRWLATEKASNLDRQDAEEGRSSENPG